MFKTLQASWKSRDYVGYFFIGPALLYILVISIFPLFSTVQTSFTTLLRGDWVFVGLRNYSKLAQDEWFLVALRNTVFLTAMVTLGHLTIGMVLALLLNEAWFPAVRNVLRGFMIVPWLFSSAAGCLMWSFLMHPLGFFNWINAVVRPGAQPINFFGDPNIAIWSIILVCIWLGFPFYMISILGGLQSIPPELYEAAKVDGASALQRYLYVTLPLLRPVMISVSTIDVIVTMGHMDTVKLLTEGGPFRTTETVAYYVWKVGLNDGNLGYGAAISTLMLILLVAFAAIYIRVLSKGGYSEGSF